MTRKILAALVGLLVAAGVSATSPIPWLNASSGGGGFGPGGEAVIWALDATVADDITAANVKGPAVTVTRAGAGKTRVTSTGTLEELSANVLKRDHIGNGTEFMVAGFNVEEARTNLVLQSEDLGTTWANLAATTPTLSTNTTTIGDLDLDKLGDDSAVLAEGKSQTVTFTADAVKVCSLFIKVGTSASSVVRLRDTTALADRLLFAVTWSGGLPIVTMTTGTSEGYDKLASGVFRIRVATTSVTAANTNSLELYPATDAALLGTPTGDVELGGFQCENGLFSTSWIPTTTGTVARAADAATLATSLIPGFSASTLAMFAEASQPVAGGDRGVMVLNNGGATERLDLRSNGFLVSDGGVEQAYLAFTNIGTTATKVAAAAALNDFAVSRAGAAVTTDTSGTMPTPTTLRIGNLDASTNFLSGHIRKLRLYNRALSDSELELLTEPDPIWEWDAGQLSLVPIKGVGTPTVTRAGNTATTVNASGLIEIVNANLPRFDYSPTSVGQLRGLLVEETRTNALLRSAEFNNASWSKDHTTVTADALTGPDGTASADQIIENTDNSSHSLFQTITFTAASWTASVYVRPAGRTWFSIRENSTGTVRITWFNLSTGTVGTTDGGHTATISAAGNGWYRCTITFTANAVAQFVEFALANGNGVITYAGDGASGVHLWGSQAEAGAFATSHIPTAGATATRAADVITLATASITGLNGSTLTMFAEAVAAAITSSVDQYLMELDDGTLNERHSIYRIGSSEVFGGAVVDGGAAVVNIGSGAWADSTVGKLAMAVAANDAAVYGNGVQRGTDASVTMPTVTTLRIGAHPTGAYFNSHIRNLRLYNVRKSNAQLEAMTAP